MSKTPSKEPNKEPPKKEPPKKDSDKGSEKEAQGYVVKIINTDKKPECCETWLEYWMTKAYNTRSSCIITKCSKPIAKGVIVQIKNKEENGEWYVVPVCEEHLKCKDKMEVELISKLIPVNKQTMKKKDPEAKFKKASKTPKEEEPDPKKRTQSDSEDEEDEEDKKAPSKKKAKTEAGAKEDKKDDKKKGKKK